MDRSSGILLAMSSLPSHYGIGTMGTEARKFVDFLSAAGQSYWQLLPLGPVSYGDSPYASPSTFAGNPYYIDLDLLVKDGLLKRSDISGINWGEDPRFVDYGRIYGSRFAVLRKAFRNGREELAGELLQFREENRAWLDDYALFMSVKAEQGMKSWLEWPEALRLRDPETMKACRERLAEDVAFWCFVQYLFFRQWNALREYAHEKGIRFIGDVPIYVAMDSADVWSEPQFFLLDEDRMPREVAGVPPDAFTDDGQLWGNPLYDWDAMKEDGYGWWIRRIEGAQKLYDVIRIDHFRGFESYWAVPYGEKTAKNGEWRKGPGIGLVRVLTQWFYRLEYIAEDLGIITEDVGKLLKESGLPGMKVLHFAFDAEGDSDYLPHNINENSVCYVGTHDNETTSGWALHSRPEDLAFAGEYLRVGEGESWCSVLLRTGMASASRLFVVQMQDVLELPPDCRMNTPGTALGNWRWRLLPGEASHKTAKYLRHITGLYRRLPENEADHKEKKGEL